MGEKQFHRAENIGDGYKSLGIFEERGGLGWPKDSVQGAGRDGDGDNVLEHGRLRERLLIEEGQADQRDRDEHISKPSGNDVNTEYILYNRKRDGVLVHENGIIQAA